jgi:hypothetical protein
METGHLGRQPDRAQVEQKNKDLKIKKGPPAVPNPPANGASPGVISDYTMHATSNILGTSAYLPAGFE